MSATVVVRYRAQAGQREALLVLLEDAQRDKQRAAGLYDTQLFTDEANGDVAWEVEHWREPADHRAHLEHAQRMGLLAPLQAVCAEAPHVSYLRRT